MGVSRHHVFTRCSLAASRSEGTHRTTGQVNSQDKVAETLHLSLFVATQSGLSCRQITLYSPSALQSSSHRWEHRPPVKLREEMKRKIEKMEEC